MTHEYLVVEDADKGAAIIPIEWLKTDEDVSLIFLFKINRIGNYFQRDVHYIIYNRLPLIARSRGHD